MKHLTVTLTGATLLTHNIRLANKLDPVVRQMAAITSKRKKTDDDLAELARLEFVGGLYLRPDNTAGMPAWNVLRSIQDGAKLHKLGRHVERAMLPIGEDVVPISHDGPDTPEAMWDAGCYDQRSIRVSGRAVTRTRPRFTNWSVTVPFVLDTEILNLQDVKMVLDSAGALVGLGDYKPRFGRYDAEIVEPF